MAVKTNRAEGLRESSIHLLRHSLHKLGKTPKEIAEKQGVTENTVVKSIAIVDAYRLSNTTEVLNSEVINTVRGVQKEVRKALKSALTSTLVGKGGTAVPNHTIQLKALAEVRQMVQSVQPKASGSRHTVMVNQQAAIHNSQTSSETKFVGFEERLRKIRTRVDEHNQLPPPASVAAPLGEDEIDVTEESDVEPEHTSG